MPIDVTHQDDHSRFSVHLEDGDAYLAYRRQGDHLDIYYTFVPNAARGQGIAAALCRAAFEYAKAHSLTVTPSCPYVGQTYLQRHPEYQALVR